MRMKKWKWNWDRCCCWSWCFCCCPWFYYRLYGSFTICSSRSSSSSISICLNFIFIFSFSFFISHFHFPFQFWFSHPFLPQIVLRLPIAMQEHLHHHQSATKLMASKVDVSNGLRSFFYVRCGEGNHFTSLHQIPSGTAHGPNGRIIWMARSCALHFV